jgi:3',5'-cyclic AMP phosphodiesterase CpdA
MQTTPRIFITAILIFFTTSFPSCDMEMETKVEDTFSFAFLTDIHVQPERMAQEGYASAIKEVNRLNPDFVITGGDLIMDALGVSYERSDSLYNIYLDMNKAYEMPVHQTLGNHEVYGWYEKAGADTNHPEYGKSMFEKRIDKRYRAFEYKGWKFLILDSVIPNGKGGYMGGIDEEQMEWIKQVLAETDTSQPIVISTHIPFLTTEAQILRGSTAANYEGEVVTNAKEVLELFESHNLKLVLQGHLHYLEHMYVWGTHYITGGAVSGRWWTGQYLRTEEGFLMIHVKGDDFTWEYVDYGWEVEAAS